MGEVNLTLSGILFVSLQTAKVSIYVYDIIIFESRCSDIEAVKKVVAIYKQIARAKINFDKTKGL